MTRAATDLQRLLLVCCFMAAGWVATAQEQPGLYVAVERGPHHRVWERKSIEILSDGRTLTNRHSYVELATGLNYLMDGQWVESREEIEVFQGAAVARQGQHSVTFADNLNSPGAIDLLSPEGKRFRSHVLGLAYTDYISGQSVMIAGIKDCRGAVLPPNQVIYQNALRGDCLADVRFTWSKSALEQDIILLTAPPPPEAYGLNSAMVRVEVWSEFIEIPEGTMTPTVLKRENDPVARQQMVEPDLIDYRLDFGLLKFEQGQAFPLGQSDPFDGSVPTGKSVERIDGRVFLIEKVDYVDIRPHLQQLPPGAAVKAPRNAGHPASARALFARSIPTPNGAPGVWHAKQYAKVEPARKGFVLDWTAVNSSLTNYTFKGDTTYLLSGTPRLYQTTVLEGGVVIKFTNSTSLEIYGPLDCRTGPHRPATLTAWNDDSIGEVLPGSDGAPSGTPAYYALACKDTATTYSLHDIRICYAYAGFVLYSSVKADISHVQVGRGTKAAQWQTGVATTWRNFLFFDVSYAFNPGGTNIHSAEHGTLHRVSYFRQTTNSGVFSLANSLLISVTNNLVYTGTNVVTSLDDSGIFQTVGAGSHYLADGSTNRGAGTTNIDLTLLAGLRQRTTYPPCVLSNNITASTNFSTFVQRNGTFPDLGYAYAPLDYVAHGMTITNATVTLSPGVVVGTYGASGTFGLQLLEGATLVAEGTPLDPCRFVRYNLVQEQATTNWSAASAGWSLNHSYDAAPSAQASFRFTEWSAPPAAPEHLYSGGTSAGTNWFRFRDCAFYNGGISAVSPQVVFTNCLFHRAPLLVYGLASETHHCTFIGGSWSVDGTVGSHNATDNLFDKTAFDPGYYGVTNDYNAYLSGYGRMVPTNGTHHVTLSSLTYEKGPLGYFYLPTNSPLLNTGSVSAASVGLYHFTTTIEGKETNSTVDIGFHYLALSNGVPWDADSDGLADYLEDPNGNGLVDAGETTWLHSDTDYDGRSDADEYADGTDPLNPGSVKLVRLGHWRFDNTSLSGDEGQVPNITPYPGTAASWSSNAVFVNTNSVLRYCEIESNGRPNINCRNGTVRFWFKPNWSSASLGGTGPRNYARWIELGAYSDTATLGLWQLAVGDTNGNSIAFTTHSNGVAETYWLAPVSLVSNRWYQIALCYSPSNVALYLNGQPTTNSLVQSFNDRPRVVATAEKLNTWGGGIYNWPPPEIRVAGFRVGNDWGGGQQVQGQFEELETFNYPLTPQEIAGGFPGFNGASGVTNDFDYDGRSDLLEYEVDGTATNDASSVAGCRLGYWRFNAPITNLLGEALQAPIYTNGISVTSGWSSNVLVVPGGSSARLVYRDVETNGWANFNARSGAVRFWFRPRWTDDGLGADGTFLFLGSATSESQGMWDLGVTTQGKTVRLRTATNGSVATVLQTANQFGFNSNKWHQIVLNYGPAFTELYVNGSLVLSNSTGVTQWPSLTDRANGLAIGNNHAGNRSINADFEELETFNRHLTAAEIQRSFDTVKASDNDLNGVADILEDVSLAVSTPFLGFPFVITGTVEAEQFDKGGKGVAYTNVADNFWTNDYRASQIEITNCADKGGGYCVNNLRSNEWLNYTIDVRVGQTYAIEPRVASIGTNIGGVFRFDFYTNGVKYTNTGPLTIASANWSDLTYRMVRLAPGTNVMRLVLLTNAPGSDYVGRFNYISVYPAWNEWWPTNGMQTNWVTGLYATNSTTNIWFEATNNAAMIQKAIDDLTGPGVVRLSNGVYFVSQKVVDESKGAEANTAVYISKHNVAVQGEGKTNTVLLCHNRSTTIFYVGFDPVLLFQQRTNLGLLDLALAGRPHLVAVTNSTPDSAKEAFTNFWESGALSPGVTELGTHLVCAGWAGPPAFTHNLAITNCVFRNPAHDGIIVAGYVTNVLIRGCDFIFRDGTNGMFPYPRYVTNTNWPTTITNPLGGVGFLARAGFNRNLVVMDNTYNGNPAMTAVNTNQQVDTGDGIVWFQGGGNWFVARNAVTNFGLEGVQFSAGPAVGVANDFGTMVSSPSTAAYVAAWSGFEGGSGDTNVYLDHSFALVANRIYGGRYGQLGGNFFNANRTPQRVHFNGNAVELHPAINAVFTWDYPGAAVTGPWSEFLNASGNTLVSGGHGIHWQDNATNALVLKNDFASATHRGLTYTGTNGAVLNITAAKNVLNQGSGSHLRLRFEDSSGFFMSRNRYRANGSTNDINAFVEAPGSPVNFLH